jgi:hypothetical protein
VNAVVRAWLGFLALGAGLIHLALVIGSEPPVGIPLAVVGAAEFAWGVFAVTRPALPLARVTRVAVLVPILGWVAFVLVGVDTVAGLRVLPMLVASLLDLAVAIGITALLRRAGRDETPIGATRYLLSLGAGALVVAALTTPALAATEAGELTVPQGELPEQPHGH